MREEKCVILDGNRWMVALSFDETPGSNDMRKLQALSDRITSKLSSQETDNE